MAATNFSATSANLKTPQRLSIQCDGIGTDTTAIRSLDWDRNRFDIEFGLRNGTTYNSFLIKGSKIALIDTSHLKFEKIWLEILQTQIKATDINYLIVNHTEPDHSGLIGHLLSLNPNIEIIASKVAIQFLENQLNKSFRSISVKTGEELNLGINKDSGVLHNLKFISAPNLHWPDTIFSFDEGTEILYTCDAFGLHYCSEDIFDINPEIISSDFRFYYDCLMGPNARSVIQALKKIENLSNISTIAVGHGPLLRHHLHSWLKNYREWSQQRSKGESYATVCYISQYGHCDQLSQAIARGINKAESQVQLIDLRSTDTQELSAIIGEANAVVIPTWPCITENDLQAAIGTMLAALKQKQWIGIYDSYGDDGEPIDSIASQLRSLKQKEAFKPLRVKHTPDSTVYQQFEEAGTDLGQLLNRKKNIATVKQLDGDLDKAMGSLSGGLYVVTARQRSGHEDRRGAMVASWVSQASFEPPGVTVAVAKDRAIETLMQTGDRFVINILKENNYQDLLRQFLKRFPPGADRFQGVGLLEDAAQGGPVLIDALAFLSCIVKQRLETPDHWIIYAEVEEGKVADIEGRTAVHHRRVGSNY